MNLTQLSSDTETFKYHQGVALCVSEDSGYGPTADLAAQLQACRQKPSISKYGSAATFQWNPNLLVAQRKFLVLAYKFCNGTGKRVCATFGEGKADIHHCWSQVRPVSGGKHRDWERAEGGRREEASGERADPSEEGLEPWSGTWAGS